MCSVLSLTFNKYDHLKETKSIIIPVINSRTFNGIFDEHHDFGLKNNQCKVMESSEYRSVCLGLTWQWNCYLKNKSKQEASTYTFNKKNHSNSHCFSASWNPQVTCCLQSLVNSSCSHASIFQLLSCKMSESHWITIPLTLPICYKAVVTTSHRALGIRWLRTKGCIYT